MLLLRVGFAVFCVALGAFLSATPGFSAEPAPAAQGALAACDNPDLSRYSKKTQVSGDLAGRDLSGKTFRKTLFLDAKLHGANLRGADLTEALICGSDLSEADLSGARLDHAMIGGGSTLIDARLAGISGRSLVIADADAHGAVFDDADLRDARIDCDLTEDYVSCAIDMTIASVAKADLRGAVIRDLCCETQGLESAKLDGATMKIPREGYDFGNLAAGVGEQGRITFRPSYGQDGETATFSGEELRRIPAVMKSMEASSARPSFDCTHAAGAVEQLICRSPRLGALDAALGWIWAGISHTEDDRKAQRAWLEGRAVPAAASEEKLMDYYSQRINELAPKARYRRVAAGTYTPDPPLLLPAGADAGLAGKFLRTRGLWDNHLSIDKDQEPDNVSGDALGANYHMCQMDSGDGERSHQGAVTTIATDEGKTAAIDEDEARMVLVVTPQAILLVKGGRHFCGARAGWADFYFRQPAAAVKP